MKFMNSISRQLICSILVLALAVPAPPITQIAMAEEPLLPLSDTENSKSWVFDERLSDEFEQDTLDKSKWQPIPFTWAKWRWEDDQISISDGDLHLNAKHSKNTSLDQTPNGWNTHVMYDNDSDNADFVTTKYGARTGQYSMVYGKFFSTWVRTDAIISNLDPAKTYQFSAWVKKRGHTPIAQLYTCSPEQKSIPLNDAKTIELSDSEEYVQYIIQGIMPTADGRCKIGFEMESDPYALTIIDDVVFAAEGGSTDNLVPNPSFEEVDPINYASGGILSRQTMKYGYMETRAKAAPALPGACSAIWLSGRSDQWGTEIDVLEVGQTKKINELDFALHTVKTPDSVANPAQDRDPRVSVGLERPNNTFNPSDDYHIYGLEWGPGYQRIYVDGVISGEFYGTTKALGVSSMSVGQSLQTTSADNMNSIPQYVYLSLGLRAPYRDEDRTDLDTTFDVDYVRIWHANNTQATGDIQDIVLNESSIVVPQGTSADELDALLPQMAPVLVGGSGQALSLLNQRDIPVSWDTGAFDGDYAGYALTLAGTLGQLPEGVTNSKHLVPSIVINIQNDLSFDVTDALQRLVDEVMALNRLHYEGGSWREIQDTLPAAQDALADASTTEEELKNAYNGLSAAKSGLLTLPDGVPVPEESDTISFIDNTDPSVQYTGDWANGRGDLANNKYLKSQHFTQTAVGTTVTHTFTGTGVDVVSGMSTNLADMTVTVSREGTVIDRLEKINLYSLTNEKTVAYTNKTLPYGTYTVELSFTASAQTGKTRGEFDGFFVYSEIAKDLQS